MQRLRLIVPLLLLAPMARAQDSAVAEMKKLDWLVGQWSGDATMMRQAEGPAKAVGTETIESKLGGRALLIQGKFFLEGEDPKTAHPIHDALGVLTYDSVAKTYRLRAYTGEGRTGDFEAKLVGPKSLQWGMKNGPADIQYKITLDEEGRWVETGEVSTDGKTWRKFLEMKLARKVAP